MVELSERVKKLMLSFYGDNPFVKQLEIKLVKAQVGRVEMLMPIDSDFHTNVYKIAHGGALMSLADTAMGATCLTLNKKVVTLEFNINCIKGAPSNCSVLAIGQVIHNGASTIVVEADIIGENGEFYAKARGTFFVIEKFTA
ncbi:MAG: phenylacetic acid degradation-related protein [Massilibacillus sp.]|nr:phenylacetic acid degradation-related protein [Massilibacillus sp.]